MSGYFLIGFCISPSFPIIRCWLLRCLIQGAMCVWLTMWLEVQRNPLTLMFMVRSVKWSFIFALPDPLFCENMNQMTRWVHLCLFSCRKYKKFCCFLLVKCCALKKKNVYDTFSYLFLTVPPTIIGPSPETVTVVVNNFVSLSCEATGFPSPTLSWLNDRGPIQANTNALIMPGTASFGWHLTEQTLSNECTIKMIKINS